MSLVMSLVMSLGVSRNGGVMTEAVRMLVTEACGALARCQRTRDTASLVELELVRAELCAALDHACDDEVFEDGRAVELEMAMMLDVSYETSRQLAS